jgi:hypothetical protein
MQLSRLQKINHSGNGPRGGFFLRHMAEVRKDGEPAASNIVVEAFRVAWQIQTVADAPHYQRRQLEGSDPAGIPAREPASR